MLIGRVLTTAVVIGMSLSAACGASLYTETWSIAGDLRGWANTNAAGTVSQAEGKVPWNKTSTADDAMDVSADPDASDGAFAGDYTAVGATHIAFDLTNETGQNAAPQVYLIGGNGQSVYKALFLPAPAALGIGKHYSIPFEEAQWSWESGPDSFSVVVEDVSQVAIYSGGPVGDTASGTLDNVALVPEPTTVILLALGSLAVITRKKR